MSPSILKERGFQVDHTIGESKIANYRQSFIIEEKKKEDHKE